jgi:tight adherence protein B
MESQDFEWAVLAISIQREVGGNLAEVLQTTAETMNMRNRLRREMKALTAEGRISAIIMAVLPFFLFGLINVVNPAYLVPLYSTTIGWALIGFAILLLIAGVLWMQKIINIEV